MAGQAHVERSIKASPNQNVRAFLPIYEINQLWIVINSLKFLVLYLKFGNLSGVLGLFVSIRWWLNFLINPRRLSKCLTRVVFLYLLKNTWLSSFYLSLFSTWQNCPLTVRPKHGLASTVRGFLSAEHFLVVCPCMPQHARAWTRALLLSKLWTLTLAIYEAR